MKKILLTLVLSIGFLGLAYCREAANSKAAALSEKAVAMIKKYMTYPVIENKPDGIDFYYHTRKFSIHRRDKTGRSTLSEEIGPEKDGLMMTFRLTDGLYAGAAMLPSANGQKARITSMVTNTPYFKETSLFGYSSKYNCSLSVVMKTPRAKQKPGLAEELLDLFNNFEDNL